MVQWVSARRSDMLAPQVRSSAGAILFSNMFAFSDTQLHVFTIGEPNSCSDCGEEISIYFKYKALTLLFIFFINKYRHVIVVCSYFIKHLQRGRNIAFRGCLIKYKRGNRFRQLSGQRTSAATMLVTVRSIGSRIPFSICLYFLTLVACVHDW